MSTKRRLFFGLLLSAAGLGLAWPTAAQTALTCDGSMGVGPRKFGGGCNVLGPTPSATDPNCNCVVYVDTSRREITNPAALFQECNGHFGHPNCPTGSRCNDSPHTTPYGNWGAEITQASFLTGALVAPRAPRNGFSQLQDCRQWPGYKQERCGRVLFFGGVRCFQWHTCTCDASTDPNHFPGEPPAQFVSQRAARAGWFTVTSTSPQCAPLNGTDVTINAQMELKELDGGLLDTSGGSDLITRFRISETVRMSCVGPVFCSGNKDFILAAGPIRADARVSVVCRNPVPRPPGGGGGGGGGNIPNPRRCGERCNRGTDCESNFCDASNRCGKKNPLDEKEVCEESD